MARAMAIAQNGDHVQAMKEVEDELARDDPGMIQYDGARVLMFTITALGEDSDLDAAEREEQTTLAKNRAVDLLRGAFDGGFLKKDDQNSPLKSDEFKPLAQLPEFKTLLDDLGISDNQ